LSNKIFDFLNLHAGEDDKNRVLENITANTSFRGANVWVLACAILIASVGLNLNSTAVIIGAMLISPLMGPILGAGFALGTYNFQLLKKSGKNLLIATGVSLTVATVYFYLSPFKDVQSELLARTSPSIYDVLIAFFGGIAGAIAVTRVEKGNPIPGVAIATALMPPLCTAGYGLATFNFSFFLGAFYLYTINCFFICIATFLMIKYLKYPPVQWKNKRYERQIRYGLTILIIVMIVPSFYLAYNLLNEKKFNQNVEKFINTEFVREGFTVIYKKVNYSSSPREIELAFLSKKLKQEEITQLNSLLPDFGIDHAKLIIRQDATDIKSEILNELGKQNTELTQKDVLINNLRQEVARYKIEDTGLIREVQILFPEMEALSIGKVQVDQATDSSGIRTVLIYRSAEKLEEAKLEAWLEQKLRIDSITIIRQQ